MTLSSEQVDKLREMWENGCPTYDLGEYEDSGYRSCWFCNSDYNLYNNDELIHEDDCPWLLLEELFG